MNIETEFRNLLNQVGLTTNDAIKADKQLHRFHVKGDKPGSMNGWYVLHPAPDFLGLYGSWKTGQEGKWRPNDLIKTSNRERKHERKCYQPDPNIQKKRRSAKNKAQFIWENSSAITDNHPYLVKKNVKNYGLRLYKGSLVVPLRNGKGEIETLQFIYPDGNKRFLGGGQKKGCFHTIGNISSSPICVAEGYATAASIYEATGFSSIVAFDAGNIKSVAQTLKKTHLNSKFIICADNDLNTPGNPGVTKAKEAASSIGAALAIPPCNGDFNDLYNGDKNVCA